MIRAPSSLTATIHIKFKYEEAEEELTEDDAVAMLKLIEHVQNLDPALQEILVKFAKYMSGIKLGNNEAALG